jgi:hypothetical protein
VGAEGAIWFWEFDLALGWFYFQPLSSGALSVNSPEARIEVTPCPALPFTSESQQQQLNL